MLGVVWALWHLPLYFVLGVVQSQLGFGLFGFWTFSVALIADAVVMAAIYNRTKRSTLSAIGYHWGLDFSMQLIAWTPSGRAIRAAITLVVALVLLASRRVRTAAVARARAPLGSRSGSLPQTGHHVSSWVGFRSSKWDTKNS
jgi:hypothetical protein